MKPLLRFDSVSKSYRRGLREVRVLNEVSLEVYAGEVVGVYGQRSAGKTTLLRLAAGFERPDAGAVTFDGVRLDGASRRTLARLRREEFGWVERARPQSDELPVLHVRRAAALPHVRPGGGAAARA